MTKKIVYYHVYLTDDYSTWAGILLEQMHHIQTSNLMSQIDEFRVTAITQNDLRKDSFAAICKTYEKKFDIEFVQNPYADDYAMLANINNDETVTENYTYRKLWNDCQNEDMLLLYIHTKGITSVINHLKAGRTNDYVKYYHWRQFLNWGVLESWYRCVQSLEVYDVAGVNYYEKPAKHFSGNFWWSKSDYIKRLPNPATKEWWRKLQEETTDQWLKYVSDRFRDEQWLCSLSNVKVCNLFELEQKDNPAAKYLPRSVYAGS